MISVHAAGDEAIPVTSRWKPELQTVLESGGFPIIHEVIEILGPPTAIPGGSILIESEIGN